ncbi:MAG TPA: hypothetical protein VGO63_04150 [Candidatus Paceibacterota bacterium]|jgi:hypothetical protein|nr:hypothetical protein [Candidatus Paceibacterota bacterium]
MDNKNNGLIKKLLFDKSAQYSGIEKEIDWKLLSPRERKDLVIKYPEQTLMRFYLIKQGLLNEKDILIEILNTFAMQSCNTFFAIVEKYGYILPGTFVTNLYFQRFLKNNDSYHALADVKNILSKCVLSEDIKSPLEDQQKFLEKLEKERMSQNKCEAGIH